MGGEHTPGHQGHPRRRSVTGGQGRAGWVRAAQDRPRSAGPVRPLRAQRAPAQRSAGPTSGPSARPSRPPTGCAQGLTCDHQPSRARHSLLSPRASLRTARSRAEGCGLSTEPQSDAAGPSPRRDVLRCRPGGPGPRGAADSSGAQRQLLSARAGARGPGTRRGWTGACGARGRAGDGPRPRPAPHAPARPSSASPPPHPAHRAQLALVPRGRAAAAVRVRPGRASSRTSAQHPEASARLSPEDWGPGPPPLGPCSRLRPPRPAPPTRWPRPSRSHAPGSPTRARPCREPSLGERRPGAPSLRGLPRCSCNAWVGPPQAPADLRPDPRSWG